MNGDFNSADEKRRHRRVRIVRQNGQALFFPAAIFYLEMVTMASSCGVMGGWSLVYIFLFSFAAGFLIDALLAFIRGRAKVITAGILMAVMVVAFGTQTVYYSIFKTFTVLSSVARAGDVLGNFGDQALEGIIHCIVPILLLLIPLGLIIILRSDLFPDRRHPGRAAVRCSILCALLHIIAILAVALNTSGITSYHYVYFNTFSPALSAPRFGILTTMRLDVKNTILPEKSEGSRPDSSSGYVSTSEELYLPEGGPRKPWLPNGLEDETQEEPVVYTPNVLEIDFDALIAGETDSTIRDMHEYFSQVEPTMKNHYTGLFEGKNLIWIVGEAFSRYALSETYTPTLTRMANEGFVFENFYTPIWGVSTSDGEYVTMTSLLPKSGVWSYSRSSSNYMAFSMAKLLGAEGYSARAYHNHTYTYYDRDSSHPNMGYDYKGVGNGLEVKKTWPESDVEMMEKTIPEYIDDEPFHTYYMTVSGHLEYTFIGNSMASKHKADVQPMLDAGYSEGAAAYIACQMELDQAIQYLIDELDKAGILEDTVIVLSGDHYPYGLEVSEMEELAGETIDETFEMYRSTCIIWNSEMRPVKVDKVCCSLDIMPTLANLFGLPYDSRLLMGRDMLSDTPGLVIFNDRSFITDLGRYSSKTDTFTPNEGETVDDSYAREIMWTVRDRFSYSAKILDYDYYSLVLQ